MKKITKASTACAGSNPSDLHTWETLEVFARGEVQQFIQRLLEEEVDDLKLSDTYGGITTLLRRRAHELYEWHPQTESRPESRDQPTGLEWAPSLPANPDVEGTMRNEMRTKAKSRTTISARQIGWLFSEE